MATSGSATDNRSTVSATLELSRTGTNVGSNYSTFYYKLSIWRQYSLNSSASKSWSISINGSTVASGTTTIGGSGTKVIKEGYVDVYHDANGSKWLAFSFSHQFDVTVSNVWIGTLSASGGFWVDDIPRASQPSGSDPDGWYWYGEQITIKTNRLSNSFTHTLRYSWHSDSDTIATGVTDSYTWTIPLSFMNYIPNDTWSWGTIYCDTYNGGTLIGTKSFKVYTSVINAYPSFTTITHSEGVSSVSTSVGKYVQGQSKLKLTITGAKGAYSSTIKSMKITFEGATYNSGDTTGIVTGSGSLKVTGTITDSRGYTATKEITVDILPYSPPVITSLTSERVNSNGTANQMGTSVNVTRTATSQSLKNGTTEKNILKYTIKTKLRTVSTWTTSKALTQISGISLTGSDRISTFDATKSYDIMIEVTDLFNTTFALGVISSGQVTMSWGRTGVGIGKIWEQGTLDVGGDTYVDGDVNSAGKVKESGFAIAPAGVIQMYGGSTAPNGFLLCQGQEVSRTTYADLFSAIGTTYGAGNGTSTFNLPDMRGRVPVGLNTGETEFNKLNNKGGAKTHKLTEAELARHWHSIKWMNGVSSPGQGAWYTTANVLEAYGGGTQRDLWANGIYANYAGGDQPHNNLQPYNTINFIIKY